MPEHERDGRPLLHGQSEELRRELTDHVAVERYKIRDPTAVQDREQYQRIFGRLSECFSLFDQQTCSLCSRLRFRRSIPFDMDKWGYKVDLEFDMLAAKRGSGGQGCDLS